RGPGRRAPSRLRATRACSGSGTAPAGRRERAAPHAPLEFSQAMRLQASYDGKTNNGRDCCVSNQTTTPSDPRSADTFPKMIRAAAAMYGDEVAFRLKGDTIPDDEITFAQLEARTAELAKGLLARGVGKGSRVGFIAGNGPSFAVYFGAITR